VYEIVIVDKKQAVMGVKAVAMVGKRERMLGVQPTEVSAESLVSTTNVDGGWR
jgi:hypothetical protein